MGVFLNGRHTEEVPSFIVLFWILLCTHRLRSDKKLVFSDNEVIDSISKTESTKSFCRQTSCFGTKRDALE